MKWPATAGEGWLRVSEMRSRPSLGSETASHPRMPGLPLAGIADGRNAVREHPPAALNKWFRAIYLMTVRQGRHLGLAAGSDAGGSMAAPHS